MNIVAIINGEHVNITSLDVNGSDIYVVYIDGTGQMKRDLLYGKGETIEIATNATIID